MTAAEVHESGDPDERKPAPGQPDGKEPDDKPEPTLLEQMGGVSGLVYSSVPVLVFVLTNAIWKLQVGIWSAIGSAVAITVIRVVRKEPLQPAISGFFGVAIAAFIAYQTGSAKGFFLFGIWTSLVYGGVFALSILLRWPLVGVIWSALNGHGQGWRQDKPSRLAYDLATLSFVVIFAARFIVQKWLYDEDLTGWLAFARLAMGYPLFALALLVTVWAVRKAQRRQREQEETGAASDEAVEAALRAKYSGEDVAAEDTTTEDATSESRR
ncbi:DUF3159 domain-containing protein [Actinokineospora auranticolor]|uniref:Uncharacterized protein DUF3159 n=1 Tax=Actinokineospora auranticolor TaxID=155976 RepID=A0A2S6GHE9_9PSEU|nr:DUF3159 domain-containing protein [Actinokineospora auranticolor]PPK64647.1 uncharacterized protein DUF3159 [Actinokineospora auranticolor]